jgi:hypothetical protein
MLPGKQEKKSLLAAATFDTSKYQPILVYRTNDGQHYDDNEHMIISIQLHHFHFLQVGHLK